MIKNQSLSSQHTITGIGIGFNLVGFVLIIESVSHIHKAGKKNNNFNTKPYQEILSGL